MLGGLCGSRERIASVGSVESFDRTPLSDSSFYAFVRAVPGDAEREWMRAFLHESIAVVPPVVYNSDDETVFSDPLRKAEAAVMGRVA